MTLNTFAAELKRKIYEELRRGASPSEGSYDADLLNDLRAKGTPQMGTTRFEPHMIHIEFIFAENAGASEVFTVSVEPPERIVFLPVPEWVVESIWQGEIFGSHAFESDANEIIDRFLESIKPGANDALFGPQMAKRRE